MRSLILAALAAVTVLLCPAAALAQQQVVAWAGLYPTTMSGLLTTATTDAVTARVPGGQWATARFTVDLAGTATATAQISIDGGKNWIASAYAKEIDAVSANPTVQAISATTLTTGQAWVVPLPANATHFRLLCGGTGTTTNVTISGGTAYVAGAPVVAVLYDVTSATNTALDTGILDVSGWTGTVFGFVTPAGGAADIYAVDDAGNSSSSAFGPAIAVGAGVTTLGGWYPGAAGTYALGTPLAKRIRGTTTAVSAVTSRLRIEARR